MKMLDIRPGSILMRDHSRAEKRAWEEFSKMIRARDSFDGYFRCPTCGRVLPIEQADAGHYLSCVRKATKFDEMNVHAQCVTCNRDITFREKAKSIYRQWLIKKYGVDSVELLERISRFGKKYSTAELLLMAKEYKARAKEIMEKKQ